MFKRELIDAVAYKSHTAKVDVKAVIETTLDVIRDELVAGGKVTLPYFGTFKVKHRAARKGRNPRTGEDLTIPAHKYPHFTAGKLLKQAVNN